MGLDYAPDGALYICANQGENNGSIIRISFANEAIEKEVIAFGINGPNGLKIWNGALYVTAPKLPKFETLKNTSGIYRFNLTDRNIEVNGDSTDANLIFTTQTTNPKRQFGLDGIAFDRQGNLYVGDLGDGEIFKIKLSGEGLVERAELYAQLPDSAGIDGMDFDEKGNLYVAGLFQNQLWRINPQGKAALVMQYPDNNGGAGGLDQPVEPVVWGNRLIISNFDLMTGPGIVNSAHDEPYTLSSFDLE